MFLENTESLRGGGLRQGDLSLRQGENISNNRMNTINEGTMSFDLLEATLKDNNLLHSPGQIHNIHETGIPLGTKTPNVMDQRKCDT